jgi:hypothetical protein
MADVVTVTIPGLPSATPATGEEQIAVYQDGRLKKMPQALLRGSKTFSGATAPPTEADVVAAMKLVLGDRWENTLTGDEWKVTALFPITFTPDGNPTATVLAPVITDVTALKTLTAPLPGQIAALQSGERYKLVTRATYAELAALTLSADTTYAVSDTDTGTHAGIASEAGYVSGQVPNSGQFAYMGSPLALRRVAALGTAAIPQLIADNNKLRETRYVSRPGENLRGWTSRIDLVGDAATPLATDANFSLANTIGGASLLLKGTVSAGPIALTRIERDKIYRVDMLVNRTVDDPSLNIVRPRFRAFSNTGADLGAVSVPGKLVMAADGLVLISFTVSTAPGVSDVQFPAVSGGYMRPYIAGQGTDGVLGICSISPPVEAPLTYDTAVYEAGDPLLFFDTSAGKFAKFDPASSPAFAALIESITMPATTTFDVSKVVGATSDMVVASLPAGDKLVEVWGQVNGTQGSVTFAFGGATAVSKTKPGVTFAAGQPFSFTKMPPGQVNAISDGGSMDVSIFFVTTGTANPNADVYANQHIARFENVTVEKQAPIRTLYKALYDGKILHKGGRIGVPAASNATNGLLKWNLENSGSFLRVSAPTFGWAGAQFDGVDDAINIGELLTSIAGANNHTVLVWTDDTVQGSTKYAIGDSGVRVGPNRTTSAATMHDLSTAQVVSYAIVGGVGGLQGVTRTTTGKFKAHRDRGDVHFEQEISVDDGPASTVDMFVGAINTVAGWSSGYAGKIMFFYVGPSLTAAERTSISNAVNAYLSAVAGF